MIMPLTKEEQSSLYYQLGKYGAFARGEDFGSFKGVSLEELLQIAFEASRWDINLLYIIVDFIAFHFKDVKIFYLRELISKSKTPQALAITLEFAKVINRSREFTEFYKFMVKGIEKPRTFMLYNLGRPFILKNLKEDALFSRPEFRKWGFLCKESPILKHLRIKKTDQMKRFDRVEILKKLLMTKQYIKLGDYLEKVGNSITRQQAHRDIIGFKNINYTGKKKGRRYFL